MKTSRKQKEKIYEAVRKALATQHKDSIEYGYKVFYPNTTDDKEMSALERNAHSIYDAIDNTPNYAVQNVMADLRGRFREMYKFVMADLYTDDGIFSDTEQAMLFLYNSMMGLTKGYLFDYEGKVTPIDDLIDYHYDDDDGL